MVAHRTRWLVALGISGAVGTACSFGVDLDGLVGGPRSLSTNDGAVVDAAPIGDGNTEPDVVTPSGAAITSIGAGNNFTCVLRSDGTVNCWGQNISGELGTGTAASSSAPVVVVNIDTATDLSVGADHACIVLNNGTVQCWGADDYHQLGNATGGQSPSPTPVVGLSQSAKHVVAGGIFTCAHLADDTAMCWGDNQHGELGDGTIAVRNAPVAVKGLTGIKQLAATNVTACALVNDGTVWCWGYDNDGEAGNGAFGPPDVLVPTQISPTQLSGVTSLTSSGPAAHFCAVLATGEGKCWGYGQSGQLGNATTSSSNVPVSAATISDATSMAVGANFTCAIHKDGSVNCWGANQTLTLPLGDGANPPSNVSTALPATGLAGALAIAGGGTHACALKDPHTVVCWGSDQYGALGRKRPLVAPTPVAVASTNDVAALAVGRDFACATRAGGALSCWGNNNFGQQARSDFAISGLPLAVPNVENAIAVSAGDTHTCYVNGDAGATQCWGEGDQGNLGNGTPYIQPTPLTYATAGGATDVGAGWNVTCALLKSTQVWCAGNNSDGRLGRAGGNSSFPSAVIVPASGDAGPSALAGVNAISVGRTGACALLDSKLRVTCWGSNSDGQLGTGGGDRSTPADVPIIKPPFAAVRMGYRHACAIAGATNDVYCWGRNANGQLTGTNTASFIVPQLIDLGGQGAKDIAVGDDHTCAVLADGTAMCWGAGTQGQLGNGGVADSSVPVVVTGLTGATAIRAAENHTCAMTATGLMCWGTDYSGQLGVSPVMETGTPDLVQGL